MKHSSLICSAILLSILLLTYVTGGAGKKFYGKVEEIKPEECKYKGYTPGGGIPDIKPIASPVAKGFKSSLSFIAGVVAQGAGVGRAGATALAAVASSVAKVAKIAGKLSAGFGVFAAAFGVVAAFTKPTPNDILNKVNDAFAEMTKDVNNRLKAMEGYVDGKVIQLEQNLIKNEFASLQRYFTSCIREPHEREVRTCQRFANKKIYGELPKFQKLSQQFNSGKDTLSMYDVKRLEASLPSFRDYASLHLYSLQLLVNSYKEDPYSDEKRSRLNLYLTDLKNMGSKYNDYAQWAYKIIHKRQIDENYKIGSSHWYSESLHKPKYGGIKQLKEGFWKAHTYDYQNVHPTCVPNDDKNPINKCEVKLMVRVDGKVPGSPYKPMYFWVSSFKDAMKAMGDKQAKSICNKYMSTLKKDLETYWKKELIDVAGVWKQVSEKATKDLGSLDAIMKLKPAGNGATPQITPTGEGKLYRVPGLNLAICTSLTGEGKCHCTKLYKIPGFNLAICTL